jgi:hypothetical protein
MKMLTASFFLLATCTTTPLDAGMYPVKTVFHADAFTQALKPLEDVTSLKDVYIHGHSLENTEMIWSSYLWFILTTKGNDIRLQRIHNAIMFNREPYKTWRKAVYAWFASADPRDQVLFIETLKNKEEFLAMCNNSPSHYVFGSW